MFKWFTVFRRTLNSALVTKSFAWGGAGADCPWGAGAGAGSPWDAGVGAGGLWGAGAGCPWGAGTGAGGPWGACWFLGHVQINLLWPSL